MDFENFITLAKLTITVCEEPEPKTKAKKTTLSRTNDIFTVMFNPESFSQTYTNEYGSVADINNKNEKTKFVKSRPSNFRLKIIIDGTGVTNLGISNLPILGDDSDVYTKVDKFLKLTWLPDQKANNKPNLLLIEWGTKLWKICRLKSVDVNYTLIDRDGTPLRAELDASFDDDSDSVDQNYNSDLDKTKSLGSAAGGLSGSSASTEKKQKGIVISVS